MIIQLLSAERAKLCALGCFTAMSLVSPVAQAGDIPPMLFNWAGLYIGASFGAAFPLHGGERLQAGSGFGSPLYDLTLKATREPASRSAPKSDIIGSAGHGSGASRRI